MSVLVAGRNWVSDAAAEEDSPAEADALADEDVDIVSLVVTEMREEAVSLFEEEVVSETRLLGLDEEVDEGDFELDDEAV